MSAPITYTFAVLHSDGTETTVPATCVTGGIVSISRLDVTDPVQLVSATITGRAPASMPTITMDDGFRITENGSSNRDLLVANYRVIYGANANLDTWELQLECAVTRIGRMFATFSWTAGTTQAAAQSIATASGFPLDAYTPDPSKARVSAQSFTNANCLDVLRQLAYTENGNVYASATSLVSGGVREYWWSFRARTFRSYAGVEFSDAGTAGALRYEAGNLDFGGLADSYWTSVIVEPTGLTPQQAGSGNRVWTVQTFDETTTQAANNALYLKSVYSNPGSYPLSIRYTNEQQTGATPTVLPATKVTFRGTSTYCVLVGSDQIFGPAQTEYVLTLASYQSGNLLTLNDSVLGRLDYNKLGY